MTASLPLPGMARGSAVFSACGRYRYSLTREWGSGGRVAYVLLNCSTATAELDDPTIRRCIGFAKSWGFGSLEITNLFAFRATDPRVMKRQDEPVGPDNDGWIRVAARRANLTVCAWGTRGRFRDRDLAVLRLLKDTNVVTYAIRVTDGGDPSHPLYLPAALKPVPYRGRPA